MRLALNPCPGGLCLDSGLGAAELEWAVPTPWLAAGRSSSNGDHGTHSCLLCCSASTAGGVLGAAGETGSMLGEAQLGLGETLTPSWPTIGVWCVPSPTYKKSHKKAQHSHSTLKTLRQNICRVWGWARHCYG